MRIIDFDDFLMRFSYWEVAAIVQSSDPRVQEMGKHRTDANIDLDNPELDKDLSILVELNLITEERKKEILK